MSIYDEIDDLLANICGEMLQYSVNLIFVADMLNRLKAKTDLLRMKEDLDAEAMEVLQKIIGLASAGENVREQLHDFAEIYKDNWQLN